MASSPNTSGPGVIAAPIDEHGHVEIDKARMFVSYTEANTWSQEQCLINKQPYGVFIVDAIWKPELKAVQAYKARG